MPIGTPRRAHESSHPLLLDAVATASPVFSATVVQDAIVLAADDGLSVRVPLEDELSAGTGPVATATAVSVVCALDTALARRLYRRVGAWHTDDDGRLTTRVRASS